MFLLMYITGAGFYFTGTILIRRNIYIAILKFYFIKS